MGKSEEETITNDSDPLLEKKNEAADPSSQLSPPQPANVIALEIEDAETDASSTACCRICLEAESEIADEADLDGGHATPMFKTGLGRSMLASENTTKKAQAVLEAEEAVKSVKNDNGKGFAEDLMFHAGIPEFAHQNISSVHDANILLEQGNFAKKGHEDWKPITNVSNRIWKVSLD